MTFRLEERCEVAMEMTRMNKEGNIYSVKGGCKGKEMKATLNTMTHSKENLEASHIQMFHQF